VSSGLVAVLVKARGAVLALLCAPALAFGQPATPATSQPISLTFDVPLNHSQRADETFTYAFVADDARTYLVEVLQQGLDLIVTVESPKGARESFDSPAQREGSEIVLLEHADPGTYLVTVSSDEHTGTAFGAHSIRVSTITEAPDTRPLAAMRLMSEAATLNREGSQTAWVTASSKYVAAAEMWKMLDQPRREAEATYSAAMIAWLRTRDRPRSAELAAQAAQLYVELADEAAAANANSLQARALRAMPGSVADKETHYARALPLLTQAAESFSRLGRLYDLGVTQNQIGQLYYAKGDWRTARRYYTDAASSLRSINEWSGETAPVSNLAALDFEEGYVETAIEEMEHTLELMPQTSRNALDRAELLGNLGVMQRVFGRYDEAIRTFSDSRALGDDLDSASVIGKALSGIGETYYSMGEFELAAEYLRLALPKRRDAADQRGQSVALRYLGSIEYTLANYSAALDLHQQALELATSPSDKALVEVLLAQDLAALGRYMEAAQSASGARDKAEAAGSIQTQADALEQLGRVQLAAAHPHEAAQFFEQALAIYTSQGLHGEQALALNGLALAARDAGELQRAVEYGEQALSHIESVRGDIADPRQRAFYLAARRDYYDLQIDLTVQLQATSGAPAGNADAALVLSERSRARSLVDLLSEAHVDLDEPNPQLAARREQLYASLGELRRQRDQRRLRGASGAADASLEIIVDQLADTENELNRLEAEARAADPRRGSLTAPQPQSGAELRAALDNESVLIEYALGEERSYAIVATREGVRAVALADRKTIEEAATRVHAGLRVPPSGPAPSRDLEALANLVLTPIVPLLTKDRLLIAADGALQYVPFAALPVVGTDGTPQPLLRTREVIGLPSLSVLISQRAAARRAPPSKAVAVFADPVFDRADPRIAFADAALAVHPVQAQLATRSSALSTGRLARLPFSADEAAAIASLVPESERYVALGFEASRETLLGLALDDYRVIHFATHGVIDTRYPDLSGLALSGFDATGSPTRGLLGLPDIYALHLNADLVVLSACETALGRDIRGEGLLGLTQGFLYAGTKGVVASLWPVADRTTAELMRQFYDHMLRDGMRPAEALRRAQLAIAADPDWRHPYYWSAFVLLGDWQ